MGYAIPISLFQSTPPRGGDLVIGYSSWSCPKFQSTPPRGGDDHCNHHEKIAGISIHAPSRGRRKGFHTVALFRTQNFNPRPLAGATVRRGSQIPSDIPVFFSRMSVFRFPKPRYPVLFLSVCFPFALTAPWGLQGRKSFWLPGAGFCSDTYCPGCRTAGCRGLCR